MGLVGFVMLIVILVLAIFAPNLAPYDPKSFEGIDSSHIYNPPSAEHWFVQPIADAYCFDRFLLEPRVMDSRAGGIPGQDAK